MNNNENLINKILTGIVVNASTKLIEEGVNLTKEIVNGGAVINVGEWDSTYDKINKLIYDLDSDTYRRHRAPTSNSNTFALNDDVRYKIKLPNNNYIMVITYNSKNDTSTVWPEHRIRLIFHGRQRYLYREKMLKQCLRLTDPDHIRVKYLGGRDMNLDIIPHTFDQIVIKDDIRKRIIKGLANWKRSKKWYEEHQLVYKMGIFLYGKPGTGKSTIARAVSNMFDNAPILVTNPDNIMDSIGGIVSMRRRYGGTIIVLIEDFDMFFHNRDDNEEDSDTSTEPEVVTTELQPSKLKKNSNQSNQNAIFQLLDGVYSTDNTIYIATTNYKDKVDSALIRYGRFDIQEELDYFDEDDSKKFVKMMGYDSSILPSLNIEYPIQPAELQSKIMEYRAINKK